MRKFLATAFLIITPLISMAQFDAPGIPFSIGYYGHYGIQPGIKVGTEISLEARPNLIKQWFISPQLGFFTNPGDRNNYIINTEGGFKKLDTKKNRYHAYSVGLGYMLQSKLNSSAINLGTGNTDSKERITTGRILPTVNYEYGWNIDRPLQWYLKYSIGSSIALSDENRMSMFIEFGVKLKLKRKRDHNE